MESIAPASKQVRSLRWVFVVMAGIGALSLGIGLTAGGFHLPSSRALGYGGVLLALGVLGAIYIQLFVANARLLIGIDQFGYQDAFGRRHLCYGSQVGRIIDFSIVDTKNSRPRRLIYFLGLDGRRLLIVSPGAWPDGAIDRLARAAGKPVEVIPAPITRADFKKEFPLAVSWAGSYGGLLLAGVLVVSVAIAVAIIFLR